MFRMVFFAVIVAAAGCSGCSKSAGNQDKVVTPPSKGDAEKIAVPGTGGDGAPAAGGSSTDDPKFHLKPEEGMLTVEKIAAKVGAEATSAITVEPAAGYHMSTDFPIKLTLEPPEGVTLAKAELNAGKGDKGDADTFSEQKLAFVIKATAGKTGTYQIKGTFKFGLCDKESCHPKKQPISINVAAN